ncbi:metallophosphoesterase [Halobaculum magnesiiphilum]|uniref:Metallophosphoesterase n=1 Tax=Halobaculum magnesiiphilum TaxID=1017351 RepID=A0A8T8WBS6_9EURY|nr:metallophosphoesterase [Halobaculum magnesiiphilum]QZP37308.1 metallophosphoesterase [Halobaculum magnesiiphilum]
MAGGADRDPPSDRRSSPLVEPVPDAPAAVADLGGETGLLIADYHAGIEAGLRYERGVELDSAGDERRERVLDLLARTGADRLVVLGDLSHRVGGAGDAEREELAALLSAVGVPVTLAPGNHDTGIAESFGDRIETTPPGGARLGDVGVLHGHTWPSPEVLGAMVVCMGHEHVAVRLEDDVGGARAEKAWLRGPLSRAAFDGSVDLASADVEWRDPELIVFPAFNDRSGGTWVNVEGKGFLAPFLPDALSDGEAYLLDGTRLGSYRRI